MVKSSEIERLGSSGAIVVVGAGYVGLITAVCFAKLGRQVVCVDTDTEKIRKLQRGFVPIFEPGVRELLRAGLRRRQLFFTDRIGDVPSDPACVFLCVGTPPRRDGSADLSYIKEAAKAIAAHIAKPSVVVVKSTVPVGTCRSIQRIIDDRCRVKCPVVSNPEFLREGKALFDFLKPDKVVIGSDDDGALKKVKRLYTVFKRPIFETTLETSELAKYAQNAFLATEISFANTLAELAERCNADIRVIMATLKLDKRVGPHAYLAPGPGYGGSCFPKDVKALVYFGKAAGVRTLGLLQAVERVNNGRAGALAKKAEFLLGSLKGRNVAFLGLTFKAGTDDIRSSPAIALAKAMRNKGARLSVYDPMGMEPAKRELGGEVRFARDAYDALRNSELAVLATEWPQFSRLRFGHIKSLMKKANILDVRNFLPAGKLQELGFNYSGVGIPYLKGMHPTLLKLLSRDLQKIKKFSAHELHELQTALRGLDVAYASQTATGRGS